MYPVGGRDFAGLFARSIMSLSQVVSPVSLLFEPVN